MRKVEHAEYFGAECDEELQEIFVCHYIQSPRIVPKFHAYIKTAHL